MLNADGPITDEPIEPVAVEVPVMFVPADDANPVAGSVEAAQHRDIVVRGQVERAGRCSHRKQVQVMIGEAGQQRTAVSG